MPDSPRAPYRLALIDDHPLVRAGVAALLETQPDFLLVGEAGDATTARTLIAETKPHLALLDLKLGRDDGLVLLRELRWLQPTLRVVVLTMLDPEPYRARARAAGASAYLHKETEPEQLLATLHEVLATPPSAIPPPLPPPADPVDGLSDRELQVFTLIGRGFANRDIASALNISHRTVEAHKEHLKKNLGIESNTQLTTAAVRWVARHHPDATD